MSPNILFVLTDNQRHDLLGCAGHPVLRTPHLDALARRGTRFSRAFATTPICSASRASILTGLYERRHQFTFDAPPLHADLALASYPALLHAAGYHTAHWSDLTRRMEFRLARLELVRRLAHPTLHLDTLDQRC